MAPVWPCRRFRYFKHFIQPLGGIVTCSPEQLPIVKEGLEAFNGYSFGERKKSMNLEEFQGRCASSVSPSATWAFLFNFLAQLDNVAKDLQEKCEYHRALSKYFCLHFLIDLIFILQNIYFCSGCLSRSYEICMQTTFSRWRRWKRIQNRISSAA